MRTSHTMKHCLRHIAVDTILHKCMYFLSVNITQLKVYSFVKTTFAIKVLSFFFKSIPIILTLSPPRTTLVPYINMLNLDETPSNSAYQPDPRCLTLRLLFHQLWETLRHLKSGAGEKFIRRAKG